MLKIRHASLSEKHKTYEWLCLSDTTAMHMGAPDYSESPVPDLRQFEEDFEDFYYLPDGRLRGSVMIIEYKNEEIGCLCYACFHLKKEKAELDIWFKGSKFCGKGFGPEALKLLCGYLNKNLGIKKMIIRPAEKNIRAIRAYEKTGFKRSVNKAETINEFLLPEYANKYGAGDYGNKNTAVLTMELE